MSEFKSFFLNFKREATPLELILASTVRHYLLNDLLVKVDMASMAHSLEVRVPFLDHRLYEFCASLPRSYHLDLFKTKKILRQAMKSVVPPETQERKKKAFYIPARRVFDDKFESYVRDHLSETYLSRSNIFDAHYVQSLTDRYFESPDMLIEKQLMCILVFAQWHQEVLLNPKTTGALEVLT